MRRLAQPVVLKSAAIAALVTTLACYPRFTLWLNRSAPVWYLEIMTFLCSMVLWGFVFAWHEYYTRRPLWVFKPELRVVLTATLLAVGAAVISHRFIDPLLRARLPEEYPGDLRQWVASVLFGLFLNRLLLLFAPFAWLMRLVRNQWVAAGLTVLFGAAVLVIRVQSLPAPLPPVLFATLLTGRILMGLLAVWFYLRGGILLIWWWTVVYEARQLFDLAGHG
ncbi:MAG: hypothetical protein ABSE16_11245 [Verrucomicrobiota bacterium]|jgi:hypothetical protein